MRRPNQDPPARDVAGHLYAQPNDSRGTMDIDWHQLIWDGRMTALEMLWNAVVINVTTHWWFGALLAVIVISAGWKKIARFGLYIARVLGHASGSS